MEQKYSSKDTCINRINKVYKQKKFRKGSIILDYGGGKYNTNTEYMEEKGCHVYVYDKYNRDESHNNMVMEAMAETQPDYAVCSNVLNVIYEEDVIEEILGRIRGFAPKTVYFAIYEGDKSGIGRKTKKGWQRNQKTSDYLPLIGRYFKVVNVKSNIITCSSLL